MISFDGALVTTWLAAYAFPLSRIAGFVATAPVWGTAGVPLRVRLLLILALTAVLAPIAPTMPAVDPSSGAGLEIIATQMLIGIVMGMAARIVFAAIDVAGEYIGYQMGLGFATFYDPVDSAQTPVMAEFLTLVAILLFLAIDGPLVYVLTLAKSFTAIPVADFTTFSSKTWRNLVHLGSLMFAFGLLLSLPIVVTLLVANVALAVLTRAAPQLNIFALGFPMTLLGGFALLGIGLNDMLPSFLHIFQLSLDAMLQVIVPASPPVPTTPPT